MKIFILFGNAVERNLKKENISRHDLGREKFVEKVWEWKQKYGDRIIFQLKKMGCSCDWERERFTMDAGLSRAVRTVFVQLYHEDLIYRGNYIINWCHRCHTALADLEVEHHEKESRLYHIRYPFENGAGHLVVAVGPYRFCRRRRSHRAGPAPGPGLSYRP